MGSNDNKHDHNQGGMIVFFIGMITTCLFFIYIVFIHKHPSPDEVANMKLPPGAAAPATQTATGPAVDPWVSSADKISKGEQIFKANCAMCHGDKGMGDGPAAAGIKPPPRNLVEGKWKFGGTPFVLFHTITNGSPGTSMAPWGQLSEDDRWALVAFIESITKNGAPATPAEIQAFKQGKK